MSIDLTEISSKLEKLDRMMEQLDSIAKESNPAADLPPASGLIKDCQSRMMQMLEALQKEKIDYWIEGKTLLAAWRSGILLPWETSIQIGMLQETWSILQESDIPARNGLKIEHDMITLLVEPPRGFLVPQLHVRRWSIYNEIAISSRGMSIAVNAILPLKEMELNGLMVPTPNEAIPFLKCEFGDGWKKVM